MSRSIPHGVLKHPESRMPFVFLEASNVRILRHVICEPHSQLNIISGANASGKSSFLEAISFLGLGRSFRTAQLEPIVRRGEKSLYVFGRYLENQVEHRVGIERGTTGRRIKVDQNSAATVADLAHTVPLQALGPDSQRVFFLEAMARRQTLAWGLFHVEPRFLSLWSVYTRLLKQRNAALRSGVGTNAWDHELSRAGEALTDMIRSHLDVLRPKFERECHRLLQQTPSLQYDQGWPADVELENAFHRDRNRDSERGFTHAGPQRADLLISLEGYAARAQASHGQQKLLLLAFRFAQLDLLRDRTGRGSVLLMDDLPTDLDRNRRGRVMERLSSLSAQCFVTTTEPELLGYDAGRSFHVEQGELHPVT